MRPFLRSRLESGVEWEWSAGGSSSAVGGGGGLYVWVWVCALAGAVVALRGGRGIWGRRRVRDSESSSSWHG